MIIIRSQDKQFLTQATSVFINQQDTLNVFISDGRINFLGGRYETPEHALWVLDQIQNVITSGYTHTPDKPYYGYADTADSMHSGFTALSRNMSASMKQKFYQMPEAFAVKRAIAEEERKKELLWGKPLYK